MPKSSCPDWCSVTPVYPQSGYFYVLLRRTPQGNLGFIPANYLFEKKQACLKHFLASKTALDKEDFTTEPLTIFFKMTFNRYIPLKKEHWTKKPQEIVPKLELFISFVHLFNYPCFFQVLTLPEGIYRKQWYFKPTIAIISTTADTQIDQLLTCLDVNVEETAKYAAVYDVSRITFYDNDKNHWFSKDQVLVVAKDSDNKATCN